LAYISSAVTANALNGVQDQFFDEISIPHGGEEYD
jgi:hypothetical protein